MTNEQTTKAKRARVFENKYDKASTCRDCKNDYGKGDWMRYGQDDHGKFAVCEACLIGDGFEVSRAVRKREQQAAGPVSTNIPASLANMVSRDALAKSLENMSAAIAGGFAKRDAQIEELTQANIGLQAALKTVLDQMAGKPAAAVTESVAGTFPCDVADCDYVGKSKQALGGHKARSTATGHNEAGTTKQATSEPVVNNEAVEITNSNF